MQWMRSSASVVGAVALGLGVFAVASCATLPSDPVDEALPNAKAGPFREIDQSELGGSRPAPNVMADDARFTRDLSVVELDGDPATFAAAGFFAAVLDSGSTPADPLAPTNAIVRHDALDGRSFARSSITVLEPEAGWEGGRVGSPSALLARGEFWLYYAAAGGVGLARSADGAVFTRAPSPVLGPEPDGWERGAIPGSPGVLTLPDGSFRMFYEVPGEAGASSIGEASSVDGVTWHRLGVGPVLSPSGLPDSGEELYDSVAVGDPSPVLATSATGRALLRVYYAGRNRAGRSAIGLAARFGAGTDVEGPLQRAETPVFGAASSLVPRAPCVVIYPDFALLFATQRAGSGEKSAYPAVVGGVAPADVVLPPPGPQ